MSAIVKLLLNTGLRVVELCALTWKDVTLTDRKGTLIVRKGKGSKRRVVSLNRDARNALASIGYKENAGDTILDKSFTASALKITDRFC